MSGIWPYVAALLPTILVAIFFYFIIKSMLEGDRRERLAQKQFEAQQDARLAAPEETGPGGGNDTASDSGMVPPNHGTTPPGETDAGHGASAAGDSSSGTHRI